MKYVINEKYGGFSLSQEALQFLRDKKGWKIAPKDRCKNMYHSDALKLIEEGYQLTEMENDHGLWGPLSVLASRDELSFRSNPDVVEAVETLGEKANGSHADLAIKDVPYSPEDGMIEIHEYDGYENLQTIPERF